MLFFCNKKKQVHLPLPTIEVMVNAKAQSQTSKAVLKIVDFY